MSRPLIGITTYGRNDENDFRLPSRYVDPIRRAGGVPVLLAPGEINVATVLERIDGLVLAGGGDIDPSLYGGSAHETIYNTDPERDATELSLARAAVERKLPTFGICRGHQLLNVALGGTLIEHLPDVVGDKVVHRLPPREPTEHAVTVQRGSRLAGLMIELEFAGVSWHHQAIRRVAAGLTVVAHAADGTIEAVEMSESKHPWLIGVQWHPELDAATNPVQQRLFDEFVKAATA